MLLQAEWTIVSRELAGIKRNPACLKLVLQGDDWAPQPSKRKFMFKLDTTKTPKWLTLVSDDGKSEWPGIYKIEGDTFTFCRPVGPGRARPTEFKGGPGVLLMVCKRLGK